MDVVQISRHFVINVIHDGEDGQDAVRLGLDNSNDSFIYDGSGLNHSAPVTAQAMLYDGVTLVTDGVTYTISDASGVTAKTPGTYPQPTYPDAAWIDPTGLLTVNGLSALVTEGYVEVQATYKGQTFYDRMTLKKLINADKYDIVIIPSAIAFNTSTGLPASTVVVINVYKTTIGGTRTKLTDLPAGYTLTAKSSSGGTMVISHESGSDEWTFDTDNVNHISYDIELKDAATNTLDAQTIPVNKSANGESGTSPYIADLDNQMDSVRCHDNGKPVDSQTVSTKLSMYYGSSLVNFTVGVKRNGVDVVLGTAASGVTVSYNTTTRILSVAYTASATINYPPDNLLKDVFDITLTHAESQTVNVERALRFCVNAVTGDVYNLKPSVSEINVGRTDAGGYNPASFSLTCGYKRKDINGNVTSVDDVQGAIDSKYFVYFRFHERAKDKSVWESYHLYTSDKNLLDPFSVVTNDSIQFVMCTGMSSGTPTGVVDIEDVPVVADGQKGPAGTKYQRIYKSNNTGTETTPQSAAYPPTGWSKEPTAITSNARYRMLSERSSSDGGTTWTAWSTPVVDAYLAEDGRSISIKGQAKAVIPWGGSLPGTAQTGDIYLMNNSDEYDIKTRTSSSWEGQDVSMNTGYLIDGHLWIKTRDTATQSEPRWEDGGQIQGPPGDDSVIHDIVCSPDSICFHSDATGGFTGQQTVTVTVKKIDGDSAPVTVPKESGTYDGYYLYFRQVIPGQTTPWYVCPGSITADASDVLSDGITGVEFILSSSPSTGNIDSGNTIKSKTVPIVLDGRRGVPGQTGATGKMFYTMGEFELGTTYERTSELVPMVFYDNGVWNEALGINGNYYYLADGKTGTNVEPESDSPLHSVWIPADSFGLVITQGIFAEFAKLGKAIWSGDYEFSMNGYIGDTEYNSGALFKGKPAYTLFAGDPSLNAYELVNFAKSVGTSYSAVSLKNMSLAEEETVVLQFSATFTGTVYIQIRARGEYSGVSFDYSTSRTSTSWSTTSELEVSSDTTYYIRFVAPSDDNYCLYARRLSSSANVTFNVSRMLFNPNWWIDLLTGKMVAAKGNFEVKPDGEVNVAGGNFLVTPNGDITVSNAKIEGSLMYHRVVMDITNFAIYPFTLYDAQGNVLDKDSATTPSRVDMNGDIIVVSGVTRGNQGFTIVLPPASYFPGVRIKIINATYSPMSRTEIVKSQINLAVYYRDDMEAYTDGDISYAFNLLTSVIPFKLYSSSEQTMMGPVDDSKKADFTPSSADNYYVYGIYGSPSTLYNTIEIVSEKNPFVSSYSSTPDYAWMIIDARKEDL